MARETENRSWTIRSGDDDANTNDCPLAAMHHHPSRLHHHPSRLQLETGYPSTHALCCHYAQHLPAAHIHPSFALRCKALPCLFSPPPIASASFLFVAPHRSVQLPFPISFFDSFCHLDLSRLLAVAFPSPQRAVSPQSQLAELLRTGCGRPK